MKNTNKKDDRKILWSILLIILMYMSSYGQYLNNDNYYLQNNASRLALIDLVVCTSIMMAIPFVWRLINRKKFNAKKGKRICMWNSIILFIISTITMVTMKIPFIGGVGALIFYFINKWLFVDENSSEKTNEKAPESASANFNETNNQKIKLSKTDKKNISVEKIEKLVCDNCGTLVKKDDVKCPKCGELFEEEENNLTRTINDKDSDLRKLKKLLDEQIITKKEFEKEKKKILE